MYYIFGWSYVKIIYLFCKFYDKNIFIKKMNILGNKYVEKLMIDDLKEIVFLIELYIIVYFSNFLCFSIEYNCIYNL